MAYDRTNDGVRIGVCNITPGSTAWTVLSSVNFTDVTTGKALADGLRFAALDALNTHTTDTVYLAFFEATTESTAVGIQVPASSFVDDLVVYGAGVITKISHQGSGTSGQAQLAARFLPA